MKSKRKSAHMTTKAMADMYLTAKTIRQKNIIIDMAKERGISQKRLLDFLKHNTPTNLK